MKVFLLTVKMYDTGGPTIDRNWVCATREKCFEVLGMWVYEQDSDFSAEPSVDVDAYFATSDDLYDIGEYEVLT